MSKERFELYSHTYGKTLTAFVVFMVAFWVTVLVFTGCKVLLICADAAPMTTVLSMSLGLGLCGSFGVALMIQDPVE